MPFALLKRLGRSDRDLSWSISSMRDAWFSSHFLYAADTVHQWLGDECLQQGRVLDFGCGDGITALGLILRHSCRDIIGVDVSRTHQRLGALARRELGLVRLPATLRFVRINPGESLAERIAADAIISWSTYEHIDGVHLPSVTADLHRVLRPGGRFFLQINPLYFSPFGSHLGRFALPPWAHLLWDEARLESTVMEYAGAIPADEIEENFHSRDFDAYKRFIFAEYRKLNRLTVDELTRLVRDCGFVILREERISCPHTPPEALLNQYSRDDLITEEIRLLLEKPAA